MKRITKFYVRGSDKPLYAGNGIYSTLKKKVKKFINPISNEITQILTKL